MNIQAKDIDTANQCVQSVLRENHKLPYLLQQTTKNKSNVYLIPSHWLCSEERTGQLNWKPFLIILWLILRHSEQNSSCICCWERTENKTLEGKLRLYCTPQLQALVPFYLPTPSFLEWSNSVRGAVAPSASMASAASLSWASSQRTPAATLWIFSMGE